MSATKTCTTCGKVKPLRGFHKKNINKDGYQDKCKACTKQYMLERSLAKLGLSLEEYQTMVEQHSNLCGICYTEELSGAGLCIDHDHSNNKVRGLLCNRCNRGLGLLGDGMESIKAVVAYLEKTQ